MMLFYGILFEILWDSNHHAEVKALKSLVRNVIAPERDLGHTDRALRKKQQEEEEKKTAAAEKQGIEEKDGKKECEDCASWGLYIW